MAALGGYIFWRLRWYSRGFGIVNCNQAKMSKKELIAALLRSLGKEPEILMELSNFCIVP